MNAKFKDVFEVNLLKCVLDAVSDCAFAQKYFDQKRNIFLEVEEGLIGFCFMESETKTLML